MELRLPLKKKWFDMTKEQIKTEDYRELSEYWVNRLLNRDKNKPVGMALCALRDGYSREKVKEIYGVSFRDFKVNVMTLGYPKKDNSEKIIKYEHLGIEIRTGKPEWGAESDELYFVIKHGKQIKN